MKRKQKEQGRSLTEMLGVLAVIGVLSIGGIIGYQYAMNKYRANDTVNELNLRAVEAAKQYGMGRTEVIDELGSPTRLGYEVALDLVQGDGENATFKIRLNQVPVKVCGFIVQSGWQVPKEISVGGVVYTGDKSICGSAEVSGEMTFVFDKDLKAGYGLEEGGDSGGTEETDPPVTEPETTPEACEGFEGSDGVCYPCDDYNGPVAPKEECLKCSNRFTTKRLWCSRCDTVDGIRSVDAAECHRCQANGGRILSKDGTCYPCQDIRGQQFETTEEECHRCAQKYYYAGTGYCFSCNDFSANPVLPESECHRCEGKIMGTDGRCYSCDDRSSISSIPATIEECRQCPNRWWGTGPEGETCNKCSISTAKTSTINECHKCDDRFMGTSGCWPCDYNVKLSPVSAGECARCPNRIYDESTKTCSLK